MSFEVDDDELMFGTKDYSSKQGFKKEPTPRNRKKSSSIFNDHSEDQSISAYQKGLGKKDRQSRKVQPRANNTYQQ